MDRLEQRILNLIDENREMILAFSNDIRLHPESGYRETRTASRLASIFRELGLPVEEGLAVTGIRAVLARTGSVDSSGNHHGERLAAEVQPDGIRPVVLDEEDRQHQKTDIGIRLPRVAILGELDGVRCDSHPEADPRTGIAHACGHHAQLGALVGAAVALTDPEVAAALCGQVDFLGIPAEEGVDGDWKRQLREEGRLVLLSGGKAELIRLGVFDDLDAVLAHHVHFAQTDTDILLGNGSTNGYTAKTVTVRGKAAHAGSRPHEGINALNAASLGLSALAYHRETFRDEDSVRIHGVITKGGGAVNVVPDMVVVEIMVRGKSLAAIQDACLKTDRSFTAGAAALGAEAQIADLPGYLPVIGRLPEEVQKKAASVLSDSIVIGSVDLSRHHTLSTDIGDLTHLMPVLHVTSGGYEGNLHGADFRITDPDTAILAPAKIHALTAYHLLKDGAREALRLRKEFQPVMSKTEYLERLGL
jgi:amidohydrolase